MKIPEKQLNKWRLLRSSGDNTMLSERHRDIGINKMSITRAFENGECSEEVYKAMASFYKAREKKLKAYL